MSIAAGLQLDIMVGVCLNPDVSGDYNGALAPNVADDPPTIHVGPHPHYWRMLYEWYMWQQLPPGYRVFCGVTVPDWSTDVEAARAAADSLSVEYDSQDDAVAICNAIVDACWEEAYNGGNGPG